MTPSDGQTRPRLENLWVVVGTGLLAGWLCFVPPTVFESADYVVYLKPALQFLADSIKAGRIPLWNPHIGLGRPFLADMQNVVFYPPAYLICLGQTFGLFLLIWLHCLLTIIGMKRLGSGLGTGPWQSYLMGFTFLASGEMMARWTVGQITYCWGLSYVPWLFYCAARTAARWEGRRLGQYGCLLALQFLCGHPQVFWFTAVGQAAFICARALRLPLLTGIREAGRGLSQFGVACAWCSGLVAVVFLPMLELITQGNRSGATREFANSYKLSWGNLSYLFNPLHSAEVNWESNLLIGGAIVVLGLAGLCQWRDRNLRGWLGVLVIGLLIAVGDSTPCFGLFYKWLPGFAGFRLHARAALLVILALICAAGMWLSRPHPRFQAAWSHFLGLPTRYAVIGLIVWQALDLAEAGMMIKGVYTPAAIMILRVPPDHSFDLKLVRDLGKAGLLQPLQPPPRIFVPSSLVPIDNAMMYGYSSFDADCSLFLRRPWDYLHGLLGVSPPIEKATLSPQVYNYGPFPYRDISLAAGVDARSGRFVTAPDPSPRAFVVYRAEFAPYATILDWLAHGHDIHRIALLEKPLTDPLLEQNALTATPATIHRFSANSFLVEAEARQKGLLVLGEAWYPGWHAEIDGREAACFPANLWMRAIPVSAGHHQVRVFFRQDYLLVGFLISLMSAGLALAMVAMPRQKPGPTPEITEPLEPGPASAEPQPGRPVEPEAARPRPATTFWQRLTALAAAGGVVSLAVVMGVHRLRTFRAERLAVAVETECDLGMTMQIQRETAMAAAHYTKALRLKPDHRAALNNLAWIRATDAQPGLRDGTEAVRLAKRACELTDYKAATPLETLATAYAEAGRFEDAVAAAQRARQLALAKGQGDLAERYLTMIQLFSNRKPYHEANPE